MGEVAALWVYPVKGMAGVRVTSCRLGPRGPEGDRRWMVVGADGRFVSQRTVPRMVLARPLPVPGGLRLEAPGVETVLVEEPRTGPGVVVEVWGDRLEARDAGDAAARWLEKVLGGRFRLVWLPREAPRRRPDGTERAAAFADAAAVLVIGEASVEDLSRRAGRRIDPLRFRANLMVGGTEPYAEDRHTGLAAGEAVLRLSGPCARCPVPGVDPATGERQRWPLEALSRWRRFGREVRFGSNAEVERPGRVRVGDRVRWLGRPSGG